MTFHLEMLIDDVLDYADAFIAIWLPGTEGQGVADVLFGDYPPSQKAMGFGLCEGYPGKS